MPDAISVNPAVNACPACGAEVPSHAPQGLCPQCVMRCVLSESDPPPEDDSGVPTTAPALPPAPTPAELAPHFPELEVLELLGQGGMGAVYKARQRKLDRLVALKVLPPEWGRDPAFAERFAREARAMARLNHPQIVGVHDFGEAGGHYYLIMEYVEGGSLRQVLADGRLAPAQALPIVGQICDALQYAHEQGVVHRDIKPENILLDRQGRVKIADFGLAKLLRRSRSEFTLTGSGQVMGTLDYMAPEQRTAPQAVDHRADIYSLGVVFYEMLTGELPLGRFAPPSDKAAVDGRLDDVIFRTLEREPDRRYQRISAVKVDVDAILRVPAPGPRTAATPRRPVRSFVLSMFSLFSPRRHAPSHGGGVIPEVLPVHPADVRTARWPPVAWNKRQRQALGLLVVAGLLVYVVIGLRHERGRALIAEREAQRMPYEGLLIGDLDELKATLSLGDHQLQQVKQVLAGADREYLEMEQRHTSRTVSQAPGSEGHLLVTVSRFDEERSQLEERMWAKLDNIFFLPGTKQDAKKQLPRGSALFAFGDGPWTIELWREGPWYHWKLTDNGQLPALVIEGQRGRTIEEGSGAELPRRYQRFWQGGPR